MRHRLVLTFAVVALLAAAVPGVAEAATILANSSADDLTVGGDHCTLRDAIEDAVFDDSNYGDCLSGNEDDTILFQLPAESTITLTLGELILPSAAMTDQAITIQGPGANELTISGADTARVFKIEHSSVATPEMISGLTIASGKVEEAGEQSEGGGVLNKGELTLAGVVVEGSEAKATGASLVMGSGGGIANTATGTLALRDSTVAGNTAGAVASGGVAYADGGGIFNQGVLTVADSTIAANGAIAGGGGGQSAGGGGIATTAGMTVTSSTIAGNTVISGGLAASANLLGTPTTELENTIVAEPLGATNCQSAVTSRGFNLEEGDSCGFDQDTDLVATDPKLAAAGLADNGGPTPTIALEPGSPALDQGLAAPGETTDQRGLPRPVALPGLSAPPGGDHADIGAFEQQAPETNESGGDGSSGGGGGGQSGGGGAPPSASPPTSPTVPTTRRLKVTIVHLASKTTRRRVTIRFHANLSGATFRCALDGARPRPCHSPFRTKKLRFGEHTFTVVATATGRHSKPAKVRFRIVRLHPRD